MKKKTKIFVIVGIILLTAALCISYFSKGRDSLPAENGESTEGVSGTLQEALSSLEEDGYKKTDEAYVLSQSEAGTSAEIIIKADANDMELDLKYDYGEGNANMKKYYREQDEAVNVLAASYMMKLASKTEVSDATMHYTIYIGGDKVRDGNMSLQEAKEYQNMVSD